jgi:hypothetical protein
LTPLPWSSTSIDHETPSAARMYDHYLGGMHTFACDRELAERVLEALPDMGYIARGNRDFVIRSVKQAAREGFDQYIDVGCGLPVTGAVHEVVRQIVPGARVVYIDNEAVAVAHGELMVATLDRTVMLNGDLRNPASFMDNTATRELLDFSRPVVLVLASVLPFVADADNPAGIMADLRDRLPSGSRLVLSHPTAGDTPLSSAKAADLYTESSNVVVLRDRDQVTALLAGYDITEPVRWVTDIYPEEQVPAEVGPRSHMYGVIATRP